MPLDLYNELHYITHIDNVSSIVSHGILSKTLLTRRKLSSTDISDPDVQRWRNDAEPVFGRAIHDYVPLYFNPLNAMLYKRRELRHSLAICAIPIQRLLNKQHVFTDGNAASRSTSFSSDINLVRTSDSVLKARSWSDLPDGRRRRCAEMLIYECVPSNAIAKIYCYSARSQHMVAAVAPCQVLIDQSMFY